jgi:hypothetical protein
MVWCNKEYLKGFPGSFCYRIGKGRENGARKGSIKGQEKKSKLHLTGTM